MPFGLGRRKEAPPPAEAGSTSADPRDRAPRPVRFHGLTEEWRLTGSMTITGRLLDTLNKREAISLADVSWAPLDGSRPFEPAPGIQAVDPYDLIVVIAGPESAASLGNDERTAHRIHKIAFDVALQAPPLRVVGTVQLHPGSEPDGLLERSSQMFVAVTRPSVWLEGVEVDIGTEADAALVNRYYLRGVEQVDLATGERHLRLPGTPLGGTTWRERT
ncbi:MAG: hypothetical protein A2V84_07210 [Chloroflexi bacterium RBG_16_70_13]|nr:MAG: hypothetical protein A2V84_07210 [Chloroflexi bacterium RBG_16_70_13]